MSNEMRPIEDACRSARLARDLLATRAQALQDEISDAQKRKLAGIRSAVAAVAEADAKVLAALQAAPQLFVKPRSVVFHGLQVGYTKGKGTIEIGDAAQTVKLIRKHFLESFDTLVKTTEKPIKAAIKNLSVGDLQKLGIKVQGTGDVVFLTDATDGVDKLVKALLKGAESEQEEDAEVES